MHLGQWFLLADWSFAGAANLLRRRYPAVRTFSTRAAAHRTRRAYGRGTWRRMWIVRIEG